MAHFAELDESGTVMQVIAVNNAELLDNGQENEAKGIAFCQSLFGHDRWKQTSYNGTIRRRFAGIGFRYDATADVFISPQPYPSWTLDANHDWQPPVPFPTDGEQYVWDEPSQSWTKITAP